MEVNLWTWTLEYFSIDLHCLLMNIWILIKKPPEMLITRVLFEAVSEESLAISIEATYNLFIDKKSMEISFQCRRLEIIARNHSTCHFSAKKSIETAKCLFELKTAKWFTEKRRKKTIFIIYIRYATRIMCIIWMSCKANAFHFLLFVQLRFSSSIANEMKLRRK